MKVLIEIPEGKDCFHCPLMNFTHTNDDAYVYKCGYLHQELKVLNNEGYIKRIIKDERCLYFKNEKISDAMIFLKNAWEFIMKTKPFSDIRVSAIMHDALTVAIKGRFKFDKEDCNKIGELFKSGSGYIVDYYLSFDEHFYSVAVAAENVSACQTFEFCRGRKPFIANGIDALNIDVAGKHGSNGLHRVCIGSRFQWGDKYVTVTSFAKDNSYFIACSYPPYNREVEGYKVRKPDHIFKITHEDLKKINKGVEGEKV